MRNSPRVSRGVLRDLTNPNCGDGYGTKHGFCLGFASGLGSGYSSGYGFSSGYGYGESARSSKFSIYTELE
jgi:hypothetical protein